MLLPYKGLVGSGWNTSQAKVIDNAIVGYAIEALNVRENDAAAEDP
jgi:hypothetical protein